MARNTINLSLGESRNVRGYTINRLPLGEYLRAIEAMRAFPRAAVDACFPGKTPGQVLTELKTIDADMLASMLMQAMLVVPREAAGLLAILTGVEQEKLLTDPAIGLDGAAEMLEAFWALNGIENFIEAVKRMTAMFNRAKAGSND